MRERERESERERERVRERERERERERDIGWNSFSGRSTFDIDRNKSILECEIFATMSNL